MNLAHWLRSARAPRPAAQPRPPARRLAVERLEERDTPSTGGLLDPTFGSGGHVLNSFTNYYDAADAVTTQPDGKIVVAGVTTASGSSRTGNDFLVARYNADGTPDTSFGTGGRTATDFNGGTDHAQAVALQRQADGTTKILAAGLVISSKGSDDFALARYNANGTLDATFGSKGKAEVNLGGNLGWAQSMAVDGTGRIVLAGYTNAPGYYVAAVVRYTANGILDNTFGSGGKLVTTIRLANQTRLDAIALQADGKIVLAGTTIDPANSAPGFVVGRFNANGTADVTFGAGGVVTAHPGYIDNFGGVAVQRDGKIVVGGSEGSGYYPPGLYLLRYNADGTPDAGFGTSGLATVLSPAGYPFNARGSGVAVQSDGKIVAGGSLSDPVAQRWDFAAVRVNADGTADTGFGGGGWAATLFGFASYSNAMAVQPDGRVLLAGSARPTPNTVPMDVALVRFLGSAPQVGSFAVTQNPDGTKTLTASGITDGNSNATVTQVEFFYFDPTGAKQRLGFGAQSADGSWSLAVSLPPGTYTLYAQATDSYGALGDPLSLILQAV